MSRISEYLSKFGKKALRKKTIDDAQKMDTPLDRCLSVWHLIFYGIAHMTGAGIYVLSGTIIKNFAGPAASISFIGCAIASAFTGLCYVEFASLLPRAGSSYTYTYCVLGELPAFIVGWTMLLDYLVSMSAVAKAFSGTVDALSNRQVSQFVIAKVGALPKWSPLDETWDFVAFGLIILLALVVLGGARFSMSVNAALSLLQILCLITITGAAFGYGSPSNWNSGKGFVPYGVPGILEGASIAMFAFSGFESISTAAEESQNPKRDLPRALMSSLLIVTFLYVTATLGLSYLQPYLQLDVTSPFVRAFALMPGAKWAEVTAGVGTLLATGATKVSAMYVIPRLLYVLATDGVLFSPFSWVETRTQVPMLGLVFGALISSVVALLFRLEFLAEMVSLGTLLSYLITGVDVFVLRYLHFATDDGSQLAEVPLRSWAVKFGSCTPCLRRVRTLKWLFAAFVIACFALGSAIQVLSFLKYVLLWSLVAVFGVLVLLLFVLLLLYKPHHIPGVYGSPLMPLAPLVAILVNTVLLMKLSPYAWLRFFSWLKIGLSVYTIYGMRHSKLGETDAASSPDEVKCEKLRDLPELTTHSLHSLH